MKRWIFGAAGTLAMGIVVLLSVYVYTTIGRARGEEWGSLDGPEPVWPAVVGFGAMWLIPISALVLIILVVVALVRAYLPRSAARN